MKCVILGTGSWGTALGQVLNDNGNDVLLYGRNREEVEDIRDRHRNSRFFSCSLSEKIRATDRIEETAAAELVLLAVPSGSIGEVLAAYQKIQRHPVLFVNVAKGFHPQSHELLSVFIKRQISEEMRSAVVSLIGPSHAEEVILRQLTAINAVSDDRSAAIKVQQLFSNRYFRVYTNDDVIGAQIGAALKNIMAIAAGILSGIGQGDNARAALITRGLAEMMRFGTAYGGRKVTYLGLDGVGDLVVTCMSLHSRNFQAGRAIGKANDAEEFLRSNTHTVEGIAACKIVYEEARRRNISMPITAQMYAVLFCGKKPTAAIEELMGRDLKAEF